MKNTPYNSFLDSLVDSFKGKDPLIYDVLANIFSMRIIGNKTHGDLAEIAVTEYINQLVDGYSATHTGKEKFRAKELEEDIRVKNHKTNEELPISLKTYGMGPLQLSTNKESTMFPYLQKAIGIETVTDPGKVKIILDVSFFVEFNDVNVLPLIYNEKEMKFKIIIFDLEKAYQSVKKIKFFPVRSYGQTRQTHPIYKFFGDNNQYIFEVRYGNAKANALQRGMWTHTENAAPFFREILSGSYTINEPLINLVSKVLVAKKEKHNQILKMFPKAKKPVL